MSNAEAENVSRYLKTKEIHLPSNNKWLLDCINWYKSNLEVKSIYNSLNDYVCIQWLLSDVKDVQQRCLPTNCKDSVTELSGKYCVQVNWVRDISQPCYTQLQALKNNDTADSNEHVSAEESKKQNWEPNPKRVLMMEITDGFTTLKAMEHSPIPRLTEPFIPGFKVVLIGPIECRKGVLFLRGNNITPLGGEVDYMSDMYSKENILSRCLNITPAESSNSSGNNASRPVAALPPPPPSVFDNRHQPEPNINDMDQLPDSTSFIDNNQFQDLHDNQNAMMEEDDDFLCQLPDTIFNDHNFNPQPNRLSPVLDHNSPEQVQSSTLENIPEETHISHNRAKNLNRPKLFPSMEDLRPEKGSSNSKSSTSTASSKNFNDYQAEASSSSRIPSVNPNTFKSSLALSKNVGPADNASGLTSGAISLNKPIESKPKEQFKNDKNLNDSIEGQIDNMLDETGDVNVYPQFKRVKVKVLNITKLRIRNGEWTCCASVKIEDESLDVTFGDKALEKLFGTSAAEVEVLRTAMAKDQSLKENINSILKSGQTKLRLLNGLMIVEFTSEGCTPNIVSIDEK